METIRGLEAEQPTGVFFAEQTVQSVIAGIERFEAAGHSINPEACRANALRFSPERFRREFQAHVAGVAGQRL